jgi:Mg-chelatase subunit ChlI
VLLETVTDDELRIVAGQLMVKAKFGDLAAIKLLFQYVLGKPAATVDPDALDVQEVELFRRAPVHGEVNEIMTARMPADLAAGLLRQVVPYVGQEHANLMYEAITNPEAFAKDPCDLDHLDEEEDQWDEEDLEDEEGSVAEKDVRPGAAERSGAAPSTNGGTSADGRRRATPPSANGPTFREKPAGRDSGNGDNGGRSPDAARPEQRPPHGM